MAIEKILGTPHAKQYPLWSEGIQFGKTTGQEILEAFGRSPQFTMIRANYQAKLAENNGHFKEGEFGRVMAELKYDVFAQIALAYLREEYSTVIPGEELVNYFEREAEVLRDGVRPRRGPLAFRSKIYDAIGATIHAGEGDKIMCCVVFGTQDDNSIGNHAIAGEVKMRAMKEIHPELFDKNASILIVIPDKGTNNNFLRYTAQRVPGVSFGDINRFVRANVIHANREEEVVRLPGNPKDTRIVTVPQPPVLGRDSFGGGD